MKKYVLFVALLVLTLLVVPFLVGCGGEETTTTSAVSSETTAAPAQDPAAIADAAIAAVTKSDAIQTPKTIKEGVLMAGSDTSFPPMEFSDEKGGYIGFDVDLCTALARKMGLQLEVVSTAWDGIIPALISGRYDIIMSAMSITEERLKQINFTDPYLPGILAISTPNVSSLSRLVLGAGWAVINPIEHLHLFNERTLRAMLEKAGYVGTWFDRRYAGLGRETTVRPSHAFRPNSLRAKAFGWLIDRLSPDSIMRIQKLGLADNLHSFARRPRE
mgnify:CR=1 FL=1